MLAPRGGWTGPGEGPSRAGFQPSSSEGHRWPPALGTLTLISCTWLSASSGSILVQKRGSGLWSWQLLLPLTARSPQGLTSDSSVETHPLQGSVTPEPRTSAPPTPGELFPVTFSPASPGGSALVLRRYRRLFLTKVGQ